MIEVVFGKVEVGYKSFLLHGLTRARMQMKWTESYFPFTHPSLELEIFFNGKWLEERNSREISPTADRWSRSWDAGL